MARKVDLDNAAKKVEDITGKVDVIMKNRLIIALFLIVDGITFLLNPDTTLGGMAQNIILLVLIAALSIFVTNLASKTKDTKTILMSLAILIVGVIFYFNPEPIAGYIQLLLALFIIYDGVSNIANTLNLSRLTMLTQNVANKFNKLTERQKAKQENAAKAARNEKFKEVDQTINDSLEEQGKKMLSPLENIVSKTSGSSKLFIAANILSVILGLILLIFPGVSMMMWGLIFLYTGIPNLMAAAKTMNLTQKIRERKFKEILLGENSKNKQ